MEHSVAYLSSIRTRLLLVIVVVLVLPAIFSMTFYLGNSRGILNQAIGDNFEALVQNNAQDVETIFIEQQADVLFLAQSSALRRYINRADDAQVANDVNGYLANFLERHAQEYRRICIIGADGKDRICQLIEDGNVLQADDENLRDRFDDPIFTEPLLMSSIPGNAPPVYIASPNRLDNGAYALRYGALLQDDRGVIIGVLMLESNLEHLTESIDCKPTCSDFMLINQDSEILLTSQANAIGTSFTQHQDDLEAQLMGQESGLIFGDRLHPDMLHAYARIAPRGQASIRWTLIYDQPMTIFNQTVLNTWQTIITIVGITSLIAFALAWGLLQDIINPLGRLTRTANEIVRGNWTSQLQPKDLSRRDEIGALTRIFQAMQAHHQKLIRDLQINIEELQLTQDDLKASEQALNEANQQLEKRVEERTKALEQSETQLRTLTDNASDFICLHDPDGTYRFVSPSCERIVGYTADELIGKNPYDYFHNEDIEAIRTAYEGSLKGEDIWHEYSILYRYHHKQGHYIWLETHTRVAVDENDKIINLVTVSRDVTERIAMDLRLRDSQQFAQTVIDSLAAHICIVDQDGVIVAVNQAWRDFGTQFGASLATRDGVGINYLTICDQAPEDYHEAHFIAQGIRDVLSNMRKTFQSEYAMFHDKPDAMPWFALEATALSFNNQTHAVISHTDISERKLVEQEALHALEQERELNYLRSQFLSMISHDFRTPLATINTTADLLMRYADRFSDAERRQRLLRIQAGVDYLDRMIDDVVYIGRAQMGQVRFEPETINFHTFAQDIATDVEIAFNTKGRIDLHYEGDVLVSIDQQIMHKVLMNLFSNAIKYSDDQIFVHIHNQDDTLRLRVKDEGIGIPAKDQANLFTTFHRASNVGNIQGTGLGLVIVKEAIEVHGGQISVESQEGVGTTFVVTVPLHDV
jgi:PAS domain S-box-containing protein